MKIINAGVTAPKGFKCAGLRAGVKPGKTNKDMAMIVSEVPAKIAGTFTKNIVKAAPVLWGKKIVEEQEAVRAVVINTGIANACTGAQGYENVVTEAKEVAKLLDIKPEEVVVGSTGVIGQQLPMDVIKEGIKKLVPELKADRQSEEDASWAILTTDTKPKEAAVEVEIDGKTVTIAGMCKGSGMIHPNMGTMLGFITTDAAIDKALLLELQRELIEDTFNMVSVDGDTSTNDTVFVFANGMAENKEITEKDADYEAFKEGLLYVNQSLAKQIAGDGEGCTRLFEVHVAGADSKENAKILSKSVVTSSLTKAAIYGKDANWGRILCALGYAGVDFDPVKVDISLKSVDGVIEIVKDGIATDYSEDEATKVLSADTVTADIDVHNGAYIMHLAGNVVQTTEDGKSRQIHNATLSSDEANSGYQALLAVERTKFQALCKKMIDVYEQLGSSEKDNDIFTNLVEKGTIQGYLGAVNGSMTLTPAQKAEAVYFGEADAEDKAVIVNSDYNYTETSYYMVHRGGSVGFEHVPVDGSSKMADDLMESIEPYNFDDAVDFQTAYLAGFLADKYDVTAEQSIDRANERVKRSTEETFAQTVKNYTTVRTENSSVQFRGGKAKYALYPVWLLNTTWNGNKYTFAMNGQTGKFVGDLPVDKSAATRWTLLLTAIYGLASYGIVWLLRLIGLV